MAKGWSLCGDDVLMVTVIEDGEISKVAEEKGGRRGGVALLRKH